MTKSELYKLIISRLIITIIAMLKTFFRAFLSGIIVGVIAAFLMKIYQRKNGKVLEQKSRNAIILFVIYTTVVLQIAILFRPIGTINKIDWIPFDTPGGVRYIILYALANALMFLPVGILVPLIWKKISRLRMILLVGFCGSFLIEICQFLLQCGVFQTEDLLMNTLGAGIGYWIYKRRIG